MFQAVPPVARAPSRLLAALTLALAMATVAPAFADEAAVSRAPDRANNLQPRKTLDRTLSRPGLKIERAPDPLDIGSYYRAQLLRRVGAPLETLSALGGAVTPGEDLLDHVLYDQLQQQVRRGLEKATRRAVERYLIDTIELDRVFGGLGRERQPVDLGHRTMAAGKRLDFDLRFHQALPKLQMHYAVPGGQLSLSVGARGAVSLAFRDAHLQNTRIQAGFDGDGRYSLNCRVSF